MWQDLKTIVSSATAVVVTTCRTSEKAVKLVENEVDNLDAEQQLRLAEIASRRTAAKPAATTATKKKPAPAAA